MLASVAWSDEKLSYLLSKHFSRKKRHLSFHRVSELHSSHETLQLAPFSIPMQSVKKHFTTTHTFTTVSQLASSADRTKFGSRRNSSFFSSLALSSSSSAAGDLIERSSSSKCSNRLRPNCELERWNGMWKPSVRSKSLERAAAVRFLAENCNISESFENLSKCIA